jgi:hypothetical protein
MAASLNERSPNKFKLGWFLVFSILALGLTLAVSFSCSSIPTSNLHIYSIRPAALIQSLADSSRATDKTSNSTSNATKALSTADFGLADLPDQYLFGISGLYRHWNQTDETRCKRRFPQVPSLLDAVLEVFDSPSVQASWTKLLTSKDISTVEDISLWKRYVTAAGAHLIIQFFGLSPRSPSHSSGRTSSHTLSSSTL